MDRRQFIAGASATALAASAPGLAQSTAAGPDDARLRTLLDGFFYDRLQDDPEAATSLGLDTGPRAALRSRLSDTSAAGRTRDLDRARRERAALRRIGRTRLSEPARIDYDVVDYQLDRTLAGARFTYGAGTGRYAPYVLSQLTGAYREVPDFLDGQHRVADAADAEAYLARLSAFPKAIDNETERQRDDAARGVFAPDFLLDTAIKQIFASFENPATKTALIWSFRGKLDKAGLPLDYNSRATRIADLEVYPALRRQHALLVELRARASHEAGAWRLPDGEAYYDAAAEAASTVAMTGDDIHRLGLEQVAEIGGRIDAILRQQGMTQGSVGERLIALNKRSDQLFPNTDPGRADLLASLERQVRTMQARLPEAFSFIPNAAVQVRRVPPSIQAGAPGGYYQNASLDGTRPGTYFINLRDTFDRPKFGLATLTYHEAVPGHHHQGMTALESQSIPLIRRQGGFSGYSEGWALYSEQLADEMGMYEGDPLGRVGYLQSLLFRATRLVVDSGLHAKRWSRERATDYFLATTGIARGRGQGEIDRYCAWPGQATSYKIGHSVWVRLREEAKRKPGFDLRRFHDVLTLGAMPLTVLERVVRERMA